MNAPKDLAVTLTMTPELQRELERSSGVLAFVQEAFPVVDSPEIANEAAAELKKLKGIAKDIQEKKGGFVAPARQIIANAEALFDPPSIAVQTAIAHLDAKLLEWQQVERERIEREERERREAEAKARADQDRREAEARAKAEAERRQREEAAARARAEQERQEAEARRLREEAAAAEGAEKKRLEAEARARDKAAREQAAKEAEERERARRAEEEAARKAAEDRARMEAELAARTAPATVATAGFSARKNWGADLAGPHATKEQEAKSEQDAILMIATAMLLGEPDPANPGKRLAPRADLVAMLTVNWKAANKLAKALEANFHVPGLVARNNPIGVSR